MRHVEGLLEEGDELKVSRLVDDSFEQQLVNLLHRLGTHPTGHSHFRIGFDQQRTLRRFVGRVQLCVQALGAEQDPFGCLNGRISRLRLGTTDFAMMRTAASPSFGSFARRLQIQCKLIHW